MVAALIMGAAIRPRPVFVKVHHSRSGDQNRNLAVQLLDSGFALLRAPE
jgi:hypothetical protein